MIKKIAITAAVIFILTHHVSVVFGIIVIEN